MSVVEKVARISRVTLAERVYRDLRELLLAGQVAPGEKFTLRGLADATGTSSMPVREAVSRLAAEGALEVMPNRAIRVPIMTRERFMELRTIRMEIEGLAAEIAAGRATPAEIDEIARHQKAFEAESRKADPDGAVALKANKELHFATYRAAAMPALMQIIEGLWLQVGPVINFDLLASGRRLHAVEAHKHHARLIQAMRARDGKTARKAVADDIASAAEFILASGNLPGASDNEET
ncbi:GntR family transcriptional regulator [Kaustia mangrovi]|uniref:GntR family transcriptional regulator n=1 Tax=Kaustia mangrovi TaxID=2593653 RepID=A0A7S8C3D8_9HYPH|nr:GntR family transcriptional regulator [Kaustia mangrovi]QPC42620.1 GntR family transcriptional regulator [Kaustia mangrovi]